MIIIKNKIFISLILIIFVIINSYAQNAIDLDGGFVALTPNGNIDDGGWPLGEQYDGVNANSSIWRTATNYVATGGAGWLQLGNPNASETTTIYLRNGITRVNDSQQDPIIYANNDFTGNLYIETRDNIRLQQDHNNGTAINVLNAQNVFINGGTYDPREERLTMGNLL